MTSKKGFQLTFWPPIKLCLTQTFLKNNSSEEHQKINNIFPYLHVTEKTL